MEAGVLGNILSPASLQVDATFPAGGGTQSAFPRVLNVSSKHLSAELQGSVPFQGCESWSCLEACIPASTPTQCSVGRLSECVQLHTKADPGASGGRLKPGSVLLEAPAILPSINI